MSPISPALTASSSATAYNTHDSSSNPFEMSLDKVQDFSDMFDFEHFDSADSGSSSHGQSPNTISPNHTPSPLPMTCASPRAFSPTFDFLNTDPQFDFDLGFAPIEKALPAKQEVVVKQEPVEFGFADSSIASSSTATTAATPAAQGFDFSGLPVDQQQALQELLTNMIQYQSQYGAELPVPSPAPNQSSPIPMAMPKTVQPAMVFNPVSAQPSASTSTSMTPVSMPAAPVAPVLPAAPSIHMDIEHDDEPLVCITEQKQIAPVVNVDDRSERQGSTFSALNDDIESKIEALVPHAAIFSAGRGKGGKKGGGMSSVVRAEDEDIDDDDSWRPSPEEYKKLSSKEKRQLRNKLSARAFRNRRKDYIGTLEGHIKDRDHVIDAIKSELVHSRSENQDLRRELAALKASTMAVLHPETANLKGESPAMMSALAQVPQFNNQANPTAPAQSQPIRRAPTPKFNVRKDVPSSPAAFNMWNNNDPLNGGSMICHTTFTPDLTLPEPAKTPFTGFADFPRMNMNPGLNDASARMPSLSARANEKDLSGSFSDWSENNAFSFRSMDSYRIQMWSRLAREAAHEKTNTPSDVRPKFYVESAYAQAAQSHISSKLASSFMSAFTGTGVAFDPEKLAAVVTGRAKLAVVDVPVVEKEKDEAELLAAALGGLRLQSGLSRVERQGLRVRENPLAALGNLFKCPCPT